MESGISSFLQSNIPAHLWSLKWVLWSSLHQKTPSGPKSAAAPSLHPVSTHKQTNSYIIHTQKNTKQFQNRKIKTQAWMSSPKVRGNWMDVAIAGKCARKNLTLQGLYWTFSNHDISINSRARRDPQTMVNMFAFCLKPLQLVNNIAHLDWRVTQM